MNKVEYLASVINEYQLKEIDYKDKEIEVTIKKGDLNQNKLFKPNVEDLNMLSGDHKHKDEDKYKCDNDNKEAKEVNLASDKVEKPNVDYIRAPLAGIFYSRPDPNAKPFVKVGDKVLENNMLCIIETMKIMNEIKADKGFKLLKALKNDGEIVEYDEVIFEVEYE